MKRNVIGIVLVLILALTTVLGSASAVSAKGKPQSTFSVEITNVYERSSQPNYIYVSFNFTWSRYKAYRSEISIVDTTISTQVVHYSIYKLRRNGEKSPAVVINKTTYPTADVSDSFTLTVTLYDRKGNLLVTGTDVWT